MRFKSILYLTIIYILMGVSPQDLLAFQELEVDQDSKILIKSLRNKISNLRFEVDQQKDKLNVELAHKEINGVENKLNELDNIVQEQGTKIDRNKVNLELIRIQVEIENLENEIGRQGGKFEKNDSPKFANIFFYALIIAVSSIISSYLIIIRKKLKYSKESKVKFMKSKEQNSTNEEEIYQDFEKNIKNKISLKKFEAHNLDFYDNFEWNFQPQVNILLGKNGYGKSHLLRAIIALLQINKKKSSEIFYKSEDDAVAKLWVLREDEAKFKIKNSTLQSLKTEGVPSTILKSLESLKTKDFSEEDKFARGS